MQIETEKLLAHLVEAEMNKRVVRKLNIIGGFYAFSVGFYCYLELLFKFAPRK